MQFPGNLPVPQNHGNERLRPFESEESMNCFGTLPIHKITAIALFVFAFAQAAFAGSIVVVNPSFEILPAGGLPNSCGAGCTYSTSAQGIPGWTVGTADGLAQVGGSGALFNFIPDGGTIAYAEDGS